MTTPVNANSFWDITLQLETKEKNIPNIADFKLWTNQVLTGRVNSAEITFRIVSLNEMTKLNNKWRKKNKPTNVLSFPLELTKNFLAGDIVICANIVQQEANAQNKKPQAHWAHMVIHGLFHILGFDHETDSDAENMEGEEVLTLKNLGFSNPYIEAKPS